MRPCSLAPFILFVWLFTVLEFTYMHVITSFCPRHNKSSVKNHPKAAQKSCLTLLHSERPKLYTISECNRVKTGHPFIQIHLDYFGLTLKDLEKAALKTGDPLISDCMSWFTKCPKKIRYMAKLYSSIISVGSWQ